MDFIIEELQAKDWPQVELIYLSGIKTGIATFQTEVPEWKEWNKGHSEVCRLVARTREEVVGWVALSPISTRCVYAGVAEVSLYVHENYRNKGIGKALLTELIIRSEKEGFWTIQSAIISENSVSRELHKKCGFREVGYRERLGRGHDGKWYDVVLMERRSNIVG